MKNIYLIFAMILLFTGCKETEEETEMVESLITSRLILTVKHDIRDCLPSNIIEEYEYSNYCGAIYFIVKSEFTNHVSSNGADNHDELKANSIKKNVVNGHLDIELPIGTFLAYIILKSPDVYLTDGLYNIITLVVQKDITLEENLNFFFCSSQ